MNLRSGLFLLATALAMAVAVTSCGGSGKATAPGVASGELNSGDFGAGASFEHRFLTSGTFPYHCIHHSPMTGSVRVGDAVTDTLVNVSITTDTAPFPDATVRTGGRVVWKNNTGMVHTVTSDR
jgi:plastocyanin